MSLKNVENPKIQGFMFENLTKMKLSREKEEKRARGKERERLFRALKRKESRQDSGYVGSIDITILPVPSTRTFARRKRKRDRFSTSTVTDVDVHILAAR